MLALAFRMTWPLGLFISNRVGPTVKKRSGHKFDWMKLELTLVLIIMFTLRSSLQKFVPVAYKNNVVVVLTVTPYVYLVPDPLEAL